MQLQSKVAARRRSPVYAGRPHLYEVNTTTLPSWVTTAAYGWDTTSADQTVALIVNSPITDKRYWEQEFVANYILSGVTDNAGHTTELTFAGWSSTNALFYALGGDTEVWGTTGTSLGRSLTSGDVVGFALDAVGKTLKLYLNNTLVSTLDLSSRTGPFYALFGFQGTGGSKIRLGPGGPTVGCTYSPPSGYSLL